MSFLNILKKIYSEMNNRQIFDPDKKLPKRELQDRYLSKLRSSSNHYSNSYNKYKCICFYYYSIPIRMVYNIVSLLAFIPLYVILTTKQAKGEIKNNEDILALKIGKTIAVDDIFPKELTKRYTVQKVIVDYNKAFLDEAARKILWSSIKGHPFSFHYNLVVMIRLATQCYIAHTFMPAAICTYVCEREFADPLLTLYSENRNISYEGFMHGDYLYEIDHAFLQYSRYWVWDEHYKNMFMELKCSQEMVVYHPGKYDPLVKPKPSESDYSYYLTYYFSGESKKEIDIIYDSFEKLRKNGKKCKVRPHPRFSNNEYIYKVFKEYTIENVKECSLSQSIGDSCFCVALNSTVLSQAFHSGIKTAIDDISNVDAFEELKKSEYIMIDKVDTFLSKILNSLSE